MASERLSRALMSFGEGLGAMAELEYRQEREEADRIHRQSLARLAEQRADARQTKEFEFRSSQNEAERKAGAAENAAERKARAAEAAADRKLTVSENQKDRRLTTQRLTAQDRRAIESQAAGLLADLDDRAIDLRDQLMEFRVEGVGTVDPTVEAKITAELAEIANARTRIRYRMIEQLASMGDPRYKDLDETARLSQAGYTDKQIEAFRSMSGKEAELSPITVDSEPRPNPNAVNPDDIIQRPSGRRQRGGRNRGGRQLTGEVLTGSEPLGGSGLRDWLAEKVLDPLMERGGGGYQLSGQRRLASDVDFDFDDDERRRGNGSP